MNLNLTEFDSMLLLRLIPLGFRIWAALRASSPAPSEAVISQKLNKLCQYHTLTCVTLPQVKMSHQRIVIKTYKFANDIFSPFDEAVLLHGVF